MSTETLKDEVIAIEQADADERQERADREAAEVEAGLIADGLPTETGQQTDYFAPMDQTFKVYFPDGISYIEHAIMTEGARRKYLNEISGGVTLKKASGDAQVKSAPGNERKIMFEKAVRGWNLVRGGQPVPYPGNRPQHVNKVTEILESLPPKLLDRVEKDIRLKNPWLLGELTVEQIDEQLEDLKDMRDRLLEEEAGK